MNEFIEKYRRLLKIYCVAARIIGWVLLITTGTWTVSTLSGYSSFSIPFIMPITIFIRILVGLVILGVAQFIRYLFETEYKPGWILRHGEKILYLYALLTILSVVWVYTIAPSDFSPDMYSGVSVILVVISTAVRVLILVGLGQILRYLMPVIEESKTLV